MKNTVAFLLMSFALPLPSVARAKPAEKVIYSFAGGGSGATITGILSFDQTGNLYGVAAGAGTGLNGVVFKLTPTKAGRWIKTDLYRFAGGADGSGPAAGVIFDKAGNLCGVTSGGGSGASGTVFKLTHGNNGHWTKKILYSFTGGSDGGSPDSILVLDETGNLYGTTPSGGSADNGTVFELTRGQTGRRWSEKVLHAFQGNTDGAQPLFAGVIFDGAGNLYGTTELGGKYGIGTVFELSPTEGGEWTETILHAFRGNPDGRNPAAGLVLSGGNLYGTTYSGGSSTCGVDNGCGTVFQLAPNGGKWKETIIHSFQGKDGIETFATPVFDQAGNLYGATFEGGSGRCAVCGTAFELTPTANGKWRETVLHDFGSRLGDAGTPESGVVLSKSGKLVGTTILGGKNNAGAVYQIAP